VILFICGSDLVGADIPFGQKTEKRRKDTSPMCETTCPRSLHTHGCGGPKMSPWFR